MEAGQESERPRRPEPEEADTVVIEDEDVFLSDRDGRVPLQGSHGYGLYYHDCRFHYGSIDATPLLLIVLGRHAAWTGHLSLFRELRGPAERALEWMHRYGDLAGDGYLEYQNESDKGLDNQGRAADASSGLPKGHPACGSRFARSRRRAVFRLGRPPFTRHPLPCHNA